MRKGIPNLLLMPALAAVLLLSGCTNNGEAGADVTDEPQIGTVTNGGTNDTGGTVLETEAPAADNKGGEPAAVTPEPTLTSDNEANSSLRLLSGEDTKALVGFAFGDAADPSRVEPTGQYLDGGEIYRLTDGSNDDLYLFFGIEGNLFSGIGAVGQADFFGLKLGTDDFDTVKSILGEPDVFEEADPVDGLPLLAYHFENSTLFINASKDGIVNQVNYRVNDFSAYTAPSSPMAADTEPELLTLAGYIVIDGDQLLLDEVEIIMSEDVSRIADLELDPAADMPNGYYFNHLGKEKAVYMLTDDTVYTFVDFDLQFLPETDGSRDYSTSVKEEFLQHLYSTYTDNPPAQNVPFIVQVKNGYVVSIEEKLLFTI